MWGDGFAAESVFLVFGVREPDEAFHLAGIPELRLSGLADDDARALLAAVVPGLVNARVRDRIVGEREGIRWRSWNCPRA